MTLKTGPSLNELMKSWNKASSPKDKNKSKPPTNPLPPLPQIPADLGLKPNPDLRKKRQMDTAKEGELGPFKGNKQARQSQDHRSRRSNSVDNREEPPVAQVRRPARTWSPVLEVDGMPIAYDATLRHYRGGHAGWRLRLWNSLSSSPRTWRSTGASTIRNSSYPLKRTWLW